MIHLDIEQPHHGASPAWARLVGAVSLPSVPVGPIDLETRIEIEDLISRACWARDERQVDVLADCLTEDAVWEGSVTANHSLGPISGRDPILAWQQTAWRLESGQCRHLPLNSIFLHREGERAATASYLLLTDSRQNVFRVRCSGFLRLDHTRTDVGWRIARIFVGWDAPPWPGKEGDLTAGQRMQFGLGEKGSEGSHV